MEDCCCCGLDDIFTFLFLFFCLQKMKTKFAFLLLVSIEISAEKFLLKTRLNVKQDTFEILKLPLPNSQFRLDLGPSFRSVLDSVEVEYSVDKCTNLEASLQNGRFPSLIRVGEELTQQLLECWSGYSALSFYAVENCLLAANSAADIDPAVCLKSAFLHKKKRLITHYLQLLVVRDYLTRNPACKMAGDDDSKILAGITEFANSSLDTDYSSFESRQYSYYSTLLICHDTPATVPPSDSSALEKRNLLVFVITGPLLILVLISTLLKILAIVSLPVTLDFLFQYYSGINQRMMEKLKFLRGDGGCETELYWGDCGIAASPESRTCGNGGSLVFDNSCTSIVLYKPGSKICQRGPFVLPLPYFLGGPNQTETELVTREDGDEQKKDSTSPPAENEKNGSSFWNYHVMGPWRFKCQSLCMKCKQ